MKANTYKLKNERKYIRKKDKTDREKEKEINTERKEEVRRRPKEREEMQKQHKKKTTRKNINNIRPLVLLFLKTHCILITLPAVAARNVYPGDCLWLSQI